MTLIKSRTLSTLSTDSPPSGDIAGSRAIDPLFNEARIAASDQFYRLKLALENFGLGTFDWDLQTNQIVWDRQHEALWGLATGQFGSDLQGFLGGLHPEYAQRVMLELTEAQTQGHAFSSEFRVIWPDGSLHWI